MFVRYYTELPAPVSQVRSATASLPGDWLPRLAEATEDKTDSLLLEVGVHVNGFRLGREGRFKLSDWVPFPSGGARVRLEWEAVEHPGLFPHVDGELEISPVGPNRTQLGLSAQYTPPLGAFGQALDAALLHRLAEAVAKDFVEAAATQIRATFAA
jgi:hypothetical protein